MSERPRRDAPVEPLPGAFDAHAHAWSREFDDDRPAVLERAWAAGLTGIVEVGVDAQSSAAALDLARREPRVHAVAGLHPHDARHLEREREPIRTLLDAGGFVAIGETGLDFHYRFSPEAEQLEAFRWQLDEARERRLPVVVHCREADAECFEVLREWAGRVGRYLGRDREIGMMHCYAGDAALAARYIELGFLISLPGVVTFRNNERGRGVAATIPQTSVLFETDSPYLAPVPRRGARNEPAFVADTIRFVAGLRGVDAAGLARQAADNASRLFGLASLAVGGGER